MPTGMIIPFAGSCAPDGWLMCDGSSVDVATYSKLYGVIGTTYGSIDGGHFNIPDLRGKTVIGTDVSYGLAQVAGSKTATLSTANMPSHSHTGTTDSAGSHIHGVTDNGHTHGYDDAYFAENRGGKQSNFGTSSSTDYDNDYIYRNNPRPSTDEAKTNISIQSNGIHTHTFTTGSTGSSIPFSIMQPSIALSYLIKYI